MPDILSFHCLVTYTNDCILNLVKIILSVKRAFKFHKYLLMVLENTTVNSISIYYFLNSILMHSKKNEHCLNGITYVMNEEVYLWKNVQHTPLQNLNVDNG